MTQNHLNFPELWNFPGPSDPKPLELSGQLLKRVPRGQRDLHGTTWTGGCRRNLPRFCGSETHPFKSVEIFWNEIHSNPETFGQMKRCTAVLCDSDLGLNQYISPPSVHQKQHFYWPSPKIFLGVRQKFSLTSTKARHSVVSQGTEQGTTVGRPECKHKYI